MRISKIKSKKNLAIPGEPMSKDEFVSLIKEAENGPFKPLGSFDEFKNDVLNAWKRKQEK